MQITDFPELFAIFPVVIRQLKAIGVFKTDMSSDYTFQVDVMWAKCLRNGLKSDDSLEMDLYS